MSKKTAIILILLLVSLLWLGSRSYRATLRNIEALIAWEKDSLRYAEQVEKQAQLVAALKPSDELIVPREQSMPNAFADPYLSAAQGVEAHLIGVRWENRWFTPEQSHGIEQIGGIAQVQLNQIVFDPDFPKAGMPDLNVELTAPRFFEMKTFLGDWLEGFDLSGFLGKSFSDRKPIKTFDLTTSPTKRHKMSLWLMEFDAFLRIEPSPDHDNTNIGNLDKHPVSGIPTRQIRNDIEAKNQRYGNVSILLRFKPKNGTWYIADTDETGVLVPNGEPKIGVGAVECIGIKPISQNKDLNNIGVYVRRGSSLALYNEPEEIDSKFTRQGINQVDAIKPIESKLFDSDAIANPYLFGKDKYAIIHLANLGSWQEGSWLSSKTRYADQYHARFVIHTYVLGEWSVQPVHIVEPEPRPPFKQKKAGLTDFLLPDFNLGWFGKLLSGGGWLIVGLIVLSIFFPPIGLLINKILGWIIALIPSKPKP